MVIGGESGALNAYDETFGRRLASNTSSVGSTTASNGVATNDLVPGKIGVTSPSLEVETGHHVVVLANTTETRKIGKSGNRRTDSGVDPFPVRINQGGIRTTFSNERKTLIERLRGGKARRSGSTILLVSQGHHVLFITTSSTEEKLGWYSLSRTLKGDTVQVGEVTHWRTVPLDSLHLCVVPVSGVGGKCGSLQSDFGIGGGSKSKTSHHHI